MTNLTNLKLGTTDYLPMPQTGPIHDSPGNLWDFGGLATNLTETASALANQPSWDLPPGFHPPGQAGENGNVVTSPQCYRPGEALFLLRLLLP
jgi:hypothetical protein